MVNPTSIIILIFGWISIISASKVCVTDKICFNLQVLEDSVQYTVTYPSSYGWVGIGDGIWMQGSDMTIVWKNSDSSFTTSDRRGAGNLEPRVMPAQSTLDTVQSQVADDQVKVVFTKPKSSFKSGIEEQLNNLGKIDMIWAYSMEHPTADPKATLTYHDDFGKFSLDLKSGDSTASSITNLWAFVHGILLFFGWNFFPFFGILAAGPLRPKLGKQWFRVHVGLMGVMAPLVVIIGIVLAIVGQTSTHFTTAHEILGLIVIIIMLLQIILGVAIDRLWNPQRTKIPWYDQLHWYCGRILFLLAQINIILGLIQYPSTPIYLFIIYGLLLLLQFLIYGLLFYPHWSPALTRWLHPTATNVTKEADQLSDALRYKEEQADSIKN